MDIFAKVASGAILVLSLGGFLYLTIITFIDCWRVDKDGNSD